VTPPAQHSAERRLLLALVGCRAEALSWAGLLSLLRQVNWQIFLTNTSEDLYPYLAFRLEPFSECIEAPRELELLFKARRNTAVHNLRLRHELGKAIEILRQAGIPVLALKGAVLAHTAYPDPSLRPMSDLDLLVQPEKREKALLALQQVGFEFPDFALATRRDHCLRLGPEEEYAPPQRLRGTAVLLEVHTQLECSEPILPAPTPEFWSRSISVDLNGLTVRTLCPEDFLFHLCLHQSRRHRFEKGLLPMVDLKLLIDSHPDWDWTGMAARSVRWRCATWMQLTLERARDLVGARVPDLFFEALPWPTSLPSLRDLAEEQIWASQRQKLDAAPLIPTLLAEPSWRYRARILFNRMQLVRSEELGPRQSLAGVVQGARLFCWRLVVTLKAKIPGFYRAWKCGQLRVSAIRKTARLLRQANTLFQLVEQTTARANDNGRIKSK
jgi:Uncharacterised nucleotidyltransferase